MSERALPTSTPAAEGVDASGVHAFLDALRDAPDIEPHSLMIVRHGRLVASGWWAPYTPERPHLLYSLSKSFTATAAGFALAEGLIDLDAPVISYFPEFAADITDARSRAMRVRHVASMSSGHLAETVQESLALDAAEPVRGFLLLPPERDPGTVFAYNQPTTYTLAAIVQRVTGQSLTAYLRPRLLDPLGIGAVSWLRDRAGRELGYSGLHATTDTVARLGQLYLNGGLWAGERLLSREWVELATREHIPTSDPVGAADPQDWERGYGFQFWQSRHGYRGDGAYGQFCLVLPEYDAVIATTAATVQMQDLLNMVWRHLLPAFGPAPLPGRARADADLAQRLAALALPPAAGLGAPPERAGDWAGAEFTPAGGVCAAQPDLTSVAVAAGPEGWTLTLTEGGEPHRLRLGPDRWSLAQEPLPTAVSGGWADGRTLQAHVLFLETPHRLVVTCALDDRTFTARWSTEPLHGGRLRSLRAPRASLL
ncbi:serine hydrolase domain-containing protein [Streptomyces sp. NPDC059766]|uniref:serine hydrolase domain-containing protein n=1 Tax=Streptomyces sp. NPDC059766 TaxID=3346940 RepID=UPI003652DC02